MTYVQFFNNASLGNISACLACPANKIVLIGEDHSSMSAYSAAYRDILSNRGHDAEFEIRVINNRDLNGIVKLLCELMEREDNLSIDITGGNELCLVASGIVYNMFGGKPKLHCFDLSGKVLYDLHKDGRSEEISVPGLSVCELVSVYGGRVIFEDEKPDGTYKWVKNREFFDDIDKAWDICKLNPKSWNKLISTLGALYSVRVEKDGLRCTSDIYSVERRAERDGGKYYYSHPIMEKLKSSGLISEFYNGHGQMSVTFKDSQIMRLLTTAGLILEMRVYLAAESALDENGEHLYGDVMNGVSIDWDGKLSRAGFDTENEIDVMLMHGAIPVYISCKNGYFNANELYKLNLVAQRFGGEYSKKIIVSSSLGSLGNSANYIKERAADMGISIIEEVKDMSIDQLQQAILRAITNV